MLLRTSISKTKKFFQKTLDNFKSLFSVEPYQRLPKNPPCPSFSCNPQLTNFYTPPFSHQGENNLHKSHKKSSTKIIQEMVSKDLESRHQEVERRGEVKGKKIEYRGKKYEPLFITKDAMEERRFWVEKGLKELEMLDKSNLQHIMDLEEILHYYSRLTCPAFIEIVDRFFMDLHSELSTGQREMTSGSLRSLPAVKRYGGQYSSPSPIRFLNSA